MKTALALIIFILAQNAHGLTEQDTRLIDEVELRHILAIYAQKSCAFNQNDLTEKVDIWSAQSMATCLYSSEFGPLKQRQKRWEEASSAEKTKYIRSRIQSCEKTNQMHCSSPYYIAVFQSWLNADTIRVIEQPGFYQLKTQNKWYENIRKQLLSAFIEVDEENNFILKPGIKAHIQIAFPNKVFFDKESATCAEFLGPDKNNFNQRSARCFELNGGVSNRSFDF